MDGRMDEYLGWWLWREETGVAINHVMMSHVYACVLHFVCLFVSVSLSLCMSLCVWGCVPLYASLCVYFYCAFVCVLSNIFMYVLCVECVFIVSFHMCFNNLKSFCCCTFLNISNLCNFLIYVCQWCFLIVVYVCVYDLALCCL